MPAFDWLEQTDKIGKAMLPDCLVTPSSILCQISALKEAIGQCVYDISIFQKWGMYHFVQYLYNFIFNNILL